MWTVESVLIIDDSQCDRDLVRRIFRGTSYKIIEAANGSEGTERSRFDQPSLIILDMGGSYPLGSTSLASRSFRAVQTLPGDETRDGLGLTLFRTIVAGQDSILS